MQNRTLLVASYVFYGWWDCRFLLLLFASSTADYWIARKLDATGSSSGRRNLLLSSALINLGFLGFFKYFNFFADSAGRLLGMFGFEADPVTLQIVLPVGISFYTFQSLGYTVDVYRGKIRAARDFADFLLYVSYFPQLVAGPIERAEHLLPQLRQPRKVTSEAVADGLWLIVVGYTKKLVIADRLAPLVQHGFGSEEIPDLNALLFVYAFAFQIYGDFSGYSDIARGVSKLLGIDLMINFRSPYLVATPSAFWRHWHISLSSWLRDYLYVPLGGNRKGKGRTLRNLMATMTLGGLWHGAGVSFLLWGFYQGVALVAFRSKREGRRDDGQGHPLARIASALLFFQVTCFGWVIFRCGAMGSTELEFRTLEWYLTGIWHPPSGWSPLWWPVSLLGLLAVFFQWQCDEMERFSAWSLRRQSVSMLLAISLIAALGVFDGGEFIYFQF